MVNRPLTSEEFDKRADAVLSPPLFVMRVIAFVLFHIVMWLVLPMWKFNLLLLIDLIVLYLVVSNRPTHS